MRGRHVSHPVHVLHPFHTPHPHHAPHPSHPEHEMHPRHTLHPRHARNRSPHRRDQRMTKKTALKAVFQLCSPSLSRPPFFAVGASPRIFSLTKRTIFVSGLQAAQNEFPGPLLTSFI